jgi:hypothetical protein
VIQTCIPQAANAFVTQYLVEIEPVLFDLERVVREALEWMNEMIALHGKVNGQEYWRDLLQMTDLRTRRKPPLFTYASPCEAVPKKRVDRRVYRSWFQPPRHMPRSAEQCWGACTLL